MSISNNISEAFSNNISETISPSLGVENLTFVSEAASISPAITLSGGAPTPSWTVTESNGTVYPYSTAGFTHNRVVAGNMTIRLLNTDALAEYVTEIIFNNDGVISDFSDLQIAKFVNLAELFLYNNTMTGDLSSFVLPSAIERLYLYNNSFTGDISSWVLPSTTERVWIYSNSLSGDLSSWVLTSSIDSMRIYSNSFTGDISSWVLPSTLNDFRINSNSFTGDLSSWSIPGIMITFYIYSNSFSGDLSSWVIPGTLTTIRLFSNSFTVGPNIPLASIALGEYRIDSNLLEQAAIDAIASSAYANRANFTDTGPVFNVDGTGNATPSGIYQDGDPPTTGKEYIYELVNDPEAEGFNTHSWTYNL
jgi:hypothetical protein